jgi:hypothetical protein
MAMKLVRTIAGLLATALTVPFLPAPAFGQTADEANFLYWRYYCNDSRPVAGGRLSFERQLEENGKFVEDIINWTGNPPVENGIANLYISWRNFGAPAQFLKGDARLNIQPKKQPPHYAQVFLNGEKTASGFAIDTRPFLGDTKTASVEFNLGELLRFIGDRPKAEWFMRTYPNKAGNWKLIDKGIFDIDQLTEIRQMIETRQADLDHPNSDARRACERRAVYADPNGDI